MHLPACLSVAFTSFALLSLFSGCRGVAKPIAEGAAGRQVPLSFLAVEPRAFDARFQLFLPRDYGRDTSTRWPLIVFLHGAGERGVDMEAVKLHGPPKIAEARPDFPFVVVSPQCDSGAVWDDDQLDALLDHVLESWSIDPARVYLTGLSMGGFGAWSWALRSPERFAAVVPICGGGTPIRAWLYGDSPKGRALRALPFWAFHGARDKVVAAAESVRMVEALRAVGCEVKYTLYPDTGHDAWVKAYESQDLYTWLLAQSRGS